MKRAVLDQGLPRSTAKILRAAGWDVVHTGEVGMAQAADEAILDWAEAQQRVCVTLDADFHALIAVHARKAPSVVRIRIEGLKAEPLATLLQRLWTRFEGALDKGALVTATPSSIRVHHLPIERQEDA